MIFGIQKRQWLPIALVAIAPLILNAFGIWQDVGGKTMLQIMRGTYGGHSIPNSLLKVFPSLICSSILFTLLLWFIVFLSNRDFFQKQLLILKILESLIVALFVAKTFEIITGFLIPLGWMPKFHDHFSAAVSLFMTDWSRWFIFPMTAVILFITFLLSGIKKSLNVLSTLAFRRINYIFFIAALLFATIGFYNFYAWIPTPKWDKSPQSLVIWIGDYYNYKPIDVQIWGDGYILWGEYLPNGNRKVYEGYLTEQEMTLLIQNLIDFGFFKRYQESKDHDGTTIEVSLIDASRSEWVDPENEQFYNFVSYLNTGAGVIGKEVIPITGTLFVTPIERTSLPKDTKANFFWQDKNFGYSLDTVDMHDKEISGDELKFAWNVINSPRPILPTIESNGQVYVIDVLLPRESQ